MINWTPEDLAQLAERGITTEQFEKQMRLFENPPPFADLVRPCTVGDGIALLSPEEHAPLLARHEEAVRAGRVLKFVPASGAASRMFKSLLAFLDSGEDSKGDVTRFVAELDRFPFAPELRMLSGSDDTSQLLRTLLCKEGLGYAALPKGQLLFHRGTNGPRTPFEEHLVEAGAYARDAQGCCRLHFTVTPAHEAGFRELLRTRGAALAQRLGVRFEVSFSHQDPSTDTPAVEMDNRPFRDAAGRLVFRPGGHGALIRNLAALEGDLVVIKNIDNVVPEARVGASVFWKKLLLGQLVAIQDEVFELLEKICQGTPREEDLDAAERLLHTRFGVEASPAFSGDRVAWLVDRLDRPLRVCAMVRNQGEPGGGPFWVRGASGEMSCQIVETSQIDLDGPEGRRLLAAATHFNPVDLVCGLRDHGGEAYDLERFVDPDTVFISRKSFAGRELKALELPGLWNGAMAGWNTHFVGVPAETFAPVKTVFDLLRPEHQV